jgi:aryl-alcohol dehydrogenase-like predicted oxidoreductase
VRAGGDRVPALHAARRRRGARSVGERLPAFARVAAERGVSAQRVVLAWHLAQAPVVIPIQGASRPETIADSAAVAEVELTPEELALLAG